MNDQNIIKFSKALIWICLGVIIFSPLYISAKLFFPFIVTKAVAFNIAVLVMFLSFLVLAWKDKKYYLRVNTVVILFGVYIILSFLSSLFGDNFYLSFWSNNERSEGLLLYLHLFLFLVVLTSFIRNIKNWLLVFDLSFFASLLVSLYALAQYFNLGFVTASAGGTRLVGTIGNAGYMAGYLIFAIFFGLLLLFYRKNIYLKGYYLSVIALEIFITIFTDTRGGMLALSIGGLIFVLYLLFFYFNNKKLKWLGFAVLIMAIVLPVLLFVNKDSGFVQSNRVLARIASISATSTTAENRLMTWGSAWQGFKERPIFGWGLENFYQPFDKYFNPAIYRHTGSVIWFDRAHNVVFEKMVTGGILGVISYLALLFFPLYYAWKFFIKKQESNEGARKYLIPLILSLIIFSYFIQNLFIFEALAIYIPLFLTLSLIGLFSPEYRAFFLQNKYFQYWLLLIFAVLLLPAIYFLHLKPLYSNLDVVKVISGAEDAGAQKRVDLLESLISKNTKGNQEYRKQYFQFYNSLMNTYAKTDDANTQKVLSDIALKLEVQLKKQIEENPYSATNYLLLMRFNNISYMYALDRLYNNLDLFDDGLVLSPTRAQFYYERGYSYYYLGRYFGIQDQKEEQDSNYNLAVEQFKKALELNDQNVEPYKQLVNMLRATGRDGDAVRYAELAKQLSGYGGATWADDVIDSAGK